MTTATTNMTHERDDVPEIGDREAVVRRDEEEVERDDREHRGDERRPVAKAHRDDDDAEQVHHHDVGAALFARERDAERRVRS